MSSVIKEVAYYSYDVNRKAIEELLQGITDQVKFIERKLTLEVDHNISSYFHIQYNEMGNIKSYVKTLQDSMD